MARLGFIHEKLDIKILILFILRRLPGEVEPETLCELCQCDGGIDYFDYSDCLSDLIETGHIKETPTGYTITDKGAKNAEAVESSLPYSVRMKALKLLAPVEERLRRAAMITARHDGKGEIIHLHLLCGDEEQAKLMEKNFRLNAENLYQEIAEMLSKK